MNSNIECHVCNTIIKNNYNVYMYADNSFCSTLCRAKHFDYIKNIDPNLMYPHKWNRNNKNTKINCFVEIDYFRVPTSIMNKSLNRSISLSNLNENKSEKMIVTSIKFYRFNSMISKNQLKYSVLIASIIMISILLSIITNKKY